jgi:heat shock protein HtpX
MEPPTLYIHPEPSVNALAIGRRNNGNIVIFDGLLTQLDSLEELNAIVGHELAHLDNRDSTLMATLTGIKQTIVSTWTWFGYTIRKGLTEFTGIDMTPVAKQNAKENMRRRSELLCSPIGLCEKSISRHREYIADAEGARIASSDAMVNALKTIGDSDQEFQEIDVSQSLCIYGLNSGLFSQLRSTHPPVEKRVRYIQKTCTQD